MKFEEPNEMTFEENKGLFACMKEKFKIALKEASKYLSDLVEEKGYFTSKDVNYAFRTALDVGDKYMPDLVQKVFSSLENKIPFIYAYDRSIDFKIAEAKINYLPYVIYDLERFGSILVISWKCSYKRGEIAGRSNQINDPTVNDLRELGYDILDKIMERM